MYKVFNFSKFIERRKKLRREMTPQEYKLWFFLKNKNLGFKFRRQHGIGPYIVDFCCTEEKLILEIDGSQHFEAKEYDQERTSYMQLIGFRVIRFWNNEIDTNMEGVLLRIKLELE
jgi:very-short-patch-repair endonuclease